MEKLLYLILGILLCFLFFFIVKDKIRNIGDTNLQEGFSSDSKLKVYNNETLYDKFYCNVYNVLFDNTDKNMFELEKIINYSKMDKYSDVLDVGSGTGFHVNYLNKKGIHAVGIDLSKSMIKGSTKLYPNNKFHYGDILKILDIDLIERENNFSHIMLLYFTIYYIKNKRLLFENCYNSMKKGGYLIIHLVDRNKFDPMVNASNPLKFVDVQSVAKERITESVVKFKDFSYKANFSLDGDNMCRFVETFINNKGNKRINRHSLFMETQKDILSMANSMGFKLKTQINLSGVGYKNQYIYILYKT